MSELRGLGGLHDLLQALGGSLLTISADAPADSAKVVQRYDLQFPLLSDASLSVIDAYGLRHHGAHPGGDAAIPAMILVDRDGIIRYKRVAHAVQDRPDPRDVAAEIRKLGAG